MFDVVQDVRSFNLYVPSHSLAMAKVYKIVDPNTCMPQTSSPGLMTDWNKCVLGQEDSTEALQCPAKSRRATQGAGYSAVAVLLESSSAIGCLPKTLKLLRLDDGDGIEATLKLLKAKWHDSCRLKYNKTQLTGAENGKTPADDAEDDMEACMRYTHKSSEHTASVETYFCGNVGFN